MGKDTRVRRLSYRAWGGKSQRVGGRYPRVRPLMHRVWSSPSRPLNGLVLPGKDGGRMIGTGLLLVMEPREKSLRGMCGDGILRQLGYFGKERHTRQRSQTGEAGVAMCPSTGDGRSSGCHLGGGDFIRLPRGGWTWDRPRPGSGSAAGNRFTRE